MSSVPTSLDMTQVVLDAPPLLSERQTTGLHLNLSRSRPPSTTSFRGSAIPGSSSSPLPFPRSFSHTSFVSTPVSSVIDDVFFEAEEEERKPLIKKSAQYENASESILTGSMASVGSFILETAKNKGRGFWLNLFKVIALFGITIVCCTALVRVPEDDENLYEVIASSTPNVIYNTNYDKDYPVLYLTVMGPVYEIDNNTGSLEVIQKSGKQNYTWHLQINKTLLSTGAVATLHHQFRCSGSITCNLSVHMTDNETSIPLAYTILTLSPEVDNEIIYAALILVFVYILIIFELVHRTLAAMLGALAALAVLSAINERPNTDTIISWMEMDTLMLLFGMMIIVAVLADTGLFDYAALMAYKLARGKVWPLVTLLCLFSTVVSAFLDNVTTILLLAPVTIRLCEVLHLEPRVILIAEVLFSNIGGTATAIGDPPNVIIVGSLSSRGITFSAFTAHLFLGIIFVTAVAYGFLRLYYRQMDHLSNPDPPDIAEINHEIDMWRRAAARLVVVTNEETLMKALFLQKALELENRLNNTLHRKRKAEQEDKTERLQQLERDYQIKDWWLLLKCAFVLTVVLAFFFMYSFVSSLHIGLGWIAVIGAMWLLVLSDTGDMESILHRVEWSTLLFFAALFILMEALVELELMVWIGEKMRDLILQVDSNYRLTAALVIIVWVSALASSFIDNIPFTTAMIPVLKQLCDDKQTQLPLMPLVTALAFGACLGGNGTLVGASANVVCAGIADQHGYTISFKQFFKVGFPMMLTTTLTATVYILICHSALHWNS